MNRKIFLVSKKAITLTGEAHYIIAILLHLRILETMLIRHIFHISWYFIILHISGIALYVRVMAVNLFGAKRNTTYYKILVVYLFRLKHAVIPLN